VTAELSFGHACTTEGVRNRQLSFTGSGAMNIYEILERCGSMPLPPYIKRMPDNEDRHRYQTVYADKPGSIAAPTAGLHFTQELLDVLSSRGIIIRRITLHVGPGTFMPVTAGEISDHAMQSEYFDVDVMLPGEMRTVKAAGKRVVTVGTTATRALEGLLGGEYCPDGSGSSGHFSGHTDIFIYPGHKFTAADALLTNFHLPRSTPLMLASAFCGLEKLMSAYRVAIARGYRFFSYGDAMLIL
jgi:S-adenosylmethionine:tRNA ribosyltransferase-isomerase